MQLRQILEQEHIPNKLLSVDRTNQAYITTKNLTLNNALELSKSFILKKELSNLIRVGDKIDHPADGSKDVADALAGMIKTIDDMGLEAAEPSLKKVAQDYNNIMNNIVKDNRMKRRLGGVFIK